MSLVDSFKISEAFACRKEKRERKTGKEEEWKTLGDLHYSLTRNKGHSPNRF